MISSLVMYKPRRDDLERVEAGLSKEKWEARVAAARSREERAKRVLRLIEQGYSQDAAIREVDVPSQRSTILRDLAEYREEGFEALIDRRMPRESEVTQEERDLLRVARRANPKITVQELEVLLKDELKVTRSETTIKRVLAEEGAARRPGRPAKDMDVEELGVAGMEILKAADLETGGVQVVVDALESMAETLPIPEPLDEKKRRLRSKNGQLTARYNRSRRRKEDDGVAPTFRSTEEKREEADLGRVKLARERRKTIERKVWAFVGMPALTDSNRFDELYGPQGAHLEGFCGYPYMPETLRKTASEWALIGAGPTIQQEVADRWHQVSHERWEQGLRASVIYVDNQVKPLWTSQFTKAAKVSSTGRVQPALVSTYIHSGAGTPIYFETHSGTAPLAPRVLEMIEGVELERVAPVGRLTVIDGECCSAALLAAFKEAGRDLITPMSAAMIRPERFDLERGSRWQEYREGDRIREGKTTLVDSKDPSIRVEVRALIIERRTKKAWTVLVTQADRDIWSARQLADVYFDRWPLQEGVFRQQIAAVGLETVHGYGKRVVANTAVITKVDNIDCRLEKIEGTLESAESKGVDVALELDRAQQEMGRLERKLEKRKERVDVAVADDQTHTASFANAVKELRSLENELEPKITRIRELDDEHAKAIAKAEKARTKQEQLRAEREKLQARTEILEADTSKDTLFTSIKITLAMLVQFAIREYFPTRPMELRTFLKRVAMLPGRREKTDTCETIVIYRNPRDQEMMEALENACDRINERNLTKDGCKLLFKLEDQAFN